jgi:hypothetical protein
MRVAYIATDHVQQAHHGQQRDHDARIQRTLSLSHLNAPCPQPQRGWDADEVARPGAVHGHLAHAAVQLSVVSGAQVRERDWRQQGADAGGSHGQVQTHALGRRPDAVGARPAARQETGKLCRAHHRHRETQEKQVVAV